MKRLLMTLTLIFILCLSAFTLTACQAPHVHTFDQEVVAEDFLASEATCTEKAKYYYSCKCGAKDETLTFESGEILGHSFIDYVYDNNATCTEDGTETSTCDRVGCNEKHTRTKNNTALSHNYDTPVYIWNHDKCIATRTCSNDNSHKETETVVAVYEKDTNATCTTPEKGHYIATFENGAFAMQETEKNSFIKGEALDHNFDKPSYTWDNDKCTATRICLRDNTHIETETVTAAYVKDTNVTCTTPEKGHYKATFVNSAFGTKETTVNSKIVGEPLNHAYGTPTYTWSDNKCTATRICANDNSHKETETVTAVYVKDTDATCTTAEKGHYIATFENSAFTTQQTTENSSANGGELGHDWGDGVTIKEATCIELGTTLFSCGRCNETKTEDIAKKSHETVSKVIEPTCDAPGYTLIYCKNCSYSDWSNFKKSKEHSGSGSCSYCGKSYVTLLGNLLIEEGTYSSGSYGLINSMSDDVIVMVHYYPSSDKLEWEIMTTSTSLMLEMNNSNGSYNWVQKAYASSGIVTVEGYVNASSFYTSTTMLPYTRIYATPALSSYPTSLINQARELAATQVSVLLDYMNVVMKFSNESITIRDFGFTSYYGVTVHEHTWAQVGTYTESTCTSNGRVNYKCASCDVTKTEIISAHGHIYAPQVKTQEETCAQVGIIEEKCYFCSYVKKTEIDKLDHNYNDVITAPTCLEDGYTTHTCPDCGDVLIDTYVDALGHKTTEHFTLKPQSCTETGIERYTCINGDCDYYEDETIPMDDHDYEEIVGAAGYVTEKCNDCEKTIATPISYTIGYNLDGGTATNKTTYTIETHSFALVNPTRKGYEFTGWTGTGLNATTMIVTISKGSLGERIYTANWTANTYTLTYDVNGGDALANNKQSVIYDVDYSTITPTRMGYSFVKWATSGGDVYSGGKWQTDSDVTLIAEWKANADTKYTVRHHKQNISDDYYTVFETDNLKGESDSDITPNVNTYTGFTSPEAIKTTILPDGNRVVDYYYTRNYYTVSFVANGGKEIETIKQKYQSTVVVLNGERPDFTFGGWFTDAELSSPYTDAIMPATNKTVYAWWREENKPTDFTYSATSNITISAYNGNSSTMQIPSFIGGVAVSCIAKYAFDNCSSLTSVTIGNNVTSIGDFAFENCRNLTSVVIGNSVISIGFCAFYNCSSVTNVNYVGAIDGWAQITFGGEMANPLYYSKNLHINNILVTEANIATATKISDYAFYNCSSLTSITIGNNVTSIGDSAFKGCKIKKATIPSIACKHIANAQLEEIVITSGANISNYVFTNNRSLLSVVIWDVENIGQRAFEYCDSLTSIVIGNGVKSIGSGAFSSCDSLRSVYYSGTAEDWNNISIGSSNSRLTSATRYYYVENESDLPADNGNYWHYVDGVPTVWVKTE